MTRVDMSKDDLLALIKQLEDDLHNHNIALALRRAHIIKTAVMNVEKV